MNFYKIYDSKDDAPPSDLVQYMNTQPSLEQRIEEMIITIKDIQGEIELFKLDNDEDMIQMLQSQLAIYQDLICGLHNNLERERHARSCIVPSNHYDPCEYLTFNEDTQKWQPKKFYFDN